MLSLYNKQRKIDVYCVINCIFVQYITACSIRFSVFRLKCSTSAELKGLADSESPLNTVNRIHCLLKMFLNAHSGFSRDDLQNYLNLYLFVINPPSDHLEKVEKIIKRVFENPKSLKYREQFVGIT